jgi:PhnB protein
MTTEYKGVPAGAPAIIPRLFCRDVDAQVDFCRDTFGAVEGLRRPGPDGRTAHAMLLFGLSMLMVEAESPALPSRAPQPDGSSPVVIYVYVEDVDATVERALARGATLVRPIETQFWGDRIGWVLDPSGHVWTIATRVEDTTEDQRKQRWSSIQSGASTSD